MFKEMDVAAGARPTPKHSSVPWISKDATTSSGSGTQEAYSLSDELVHLWAWVRPRSERVSASEAMRD